MMHIAHFEIGKYLAHFVESVLTNWPESDDVKHVREYLDHGEYGEALDNLIAVGLDNGIGFSPDQLQHVDELAAAMDMTDSAALARLREAGNHDAPGM